MLVFTAVKNKLDLMTWLQPALADLGTTGISAGGLCIKVFLRHQRRRRYPDVFLPAGIAIFDGILRLIGRVKPFFTP